MTTPPPHHKRRLPPAPICRRRFWRRQAPCRAAHYASSRTRVHAHWLVESDKSVRSFAPPIAAGAGSLLVELRRVRGTCFTRAQRALSGGWDAWFGSRAAVSACRGGLAVPVRAVRRRDLSTAAVGYDQLSSPSLYVNPSARREH